LVLGGATLLFVVAALSATDRRGGVLDEVLDLHPPLPVARGTCGGRVLSKEVSHRVRKIFQARLGMEDVSGKRPPPGAEGGHGWRAEVQEHSCVVAWRTVHMGDAHDPRQAVWAHQPAIEASTRHPRRTKVGELPLAGMEVAKGVGELGILHPLQERLATVEATRAGRGGGVRLVGGVHDAVEIATHDEGAAGGREGVQSLQERGALTTLAGGVHAHDA
jgi:hypothetical protein